jgi:hypothetical protein
VSHQRNGRPRPYPASTAPSSAALLRAREILDLPAHWSFIAYLCIGWPQEEHDDPELERQGWEERMGQEALTPLVR